MKKVLKLVAVLLGIGIIAGCMNTPSKERMNEELKKNKGGGGNAG